MLSRQPVATEADRKAALERVGQYDRFIDREIEVLRSGLSTGYSAPRVNVERETGSAPASGSNSARKAFDDLFKF